MPLTDDWHSWKAKGQRHMVAFVMTFDMLYVAL